MLNVNNKNTSKVFGTRFFFLIFETQSSFQNEKDIFQRTDYLECTRIAPEELKFHSYFVLSTKKLWIMAPIIHVGFMKFSRFIKNEKITTDVM